MLVSSVKGQGLTPSGDIATLVIREVPTTRLQTVFASPRYR